MLCVTMNVVQGVAGEVLPYKGNVTRLPVEGRILSSRKERL